MQKVNGRQWAWVGVLAILAIGTPLSADAATRTWDNGGDRTNWFDANNWDLNLVPVDGDAVTIPSGYSVLLTNSTPQLDSFSITNSTLTFSNWATALQATNVTIWNNGKLTHAACNTNPVVSNTNRVYIIASNVAIAVGGGIDVSLMGYSYGGFSVAGVGQTNGYGQGPGGGHCNWLPSNGQGFVGGGSYGGAGARQDGSYLVYGSAQAPTDPGSGGGGLNWTPGYLGSAGGGAVRIQASGLVTVNGQILANSTARGGYSGAGSGGAIYITCDQFAGATGLIQADGGGSSATALNAGGGAGGGGRVAVVYNPASEAGVSPSPTVRFSAAGGYGAVIEDAQRNRSITYGTPGTIYLPDTLALSPNLLGGLLVIPGFTAWAPGGLTVSNGVAAFTNGFQLTVTNQVLIQGTGGLLLSNSAVSIGGALTISNSSTYGKCFLYGGPSASFTVGGSAIFSGGRIEIVNPSTTAYPMNVGGDLIITNAALFPIYSGPTNGVPPDYGVLVSVTGTMAVAANSFIYPYSHSTNGGSVLFQVSNLTVGAAGSINADGLGYAAGWSGFGAGSSQANGWGPGGGHRNYTGGGGADGGGGYGGRGGRCDGTNGITYGLAAMPIDPGSGGGSLDWVGGYYGSAGGGSVRIQASGKVTINGTLTACSTPTPVSDYRAGGSGGGIYIACRTFQGSGVIAANGADYIGGSSQNGSAAGGGGRVAIVYDIPSQAAVTPKPSIQISASGGYGLVIEDARRNMTILQGQPGTIYLTDSSFFPAATLWGGQIVTPGFTSWAVGSLSVPSGMAGFVDGFQLTVTNDVQVGGTAGLIFSNAAVSIGGNLNITNTSSYGKSFVYGGPSASLNVGGNLTLGAGRLELRSAATTPLSITVNGSLGLTNGAALAVYSAATNGVAPDYGALVSVLGELYVGSNCFVYPYSHQTNGGSAMFMVGSLNLAAFGTVSADGRGYAGGLVPSADGLGPGKGKGQVGPTAGGYGGLGGGASGAYGQTYGSSNAPIAPGSGPGSTVNFAQISEGGGAVRIKASRKVTLNGTITASSADTSTDYASGSGGGVYISCRTIEGNGTIRANGGNFTGNARGGAGGGGRVAVWRLADTFAGTATASGGAATLLPANAGGTGTVAWLDLQLPRGTVLIIR